jgi:hypothetical protein
LLNRLLPRMNRLRVCLLGSGYPTFWLCDLGPAVFLLALSGWCIQPFSQSGLYLAAPREAVGSEQFVAVGETLKRLGKATFDDAVRSTNIAPEIVRTALSRLCEQGQSMYDIGDGCYRWRQALHIPVEELRADNDSKRESDAAELLRAGAVTVGEEHRSLDGATVKGKVRGKNGDYGVMLTMDTTGRIIDGECGCAWYRYNHLHSGPCKHLLALRLAFAKA